MTSGIDLTEETIFTWGAPPLKFGAGASDEIGFELSQYGVRRVLIDTAKAVNLLSSHPGELMDPAAAKVGPREQLPSVLVSLMRDIGIPNGIGGVGYTEADVPDLVPGTMRQQRLLATCPKIPTEDDIAGILTRSVENW